MKVRVHPHRTKVKSGEEQCVSITPVGGKAYYKGSVILENVYFVIYTNGLELARKLGQRTVHAWATGDLAASHDAQIPLDDKFLRLAEQVTYHYQDGRFLTLAGRDVTKERFDFGYFCGKDFYVWNDV